MDAVAADRGRAREGKHVYIHMLNHPLTDRAAGTGDHVIAPVRQSCFGKDFTQDQSRRGGRFRRLGDDSASRGQNVRHALAENQEGEVPRRDDSDDADRFAGDKAEHSVAKIVEGIAMQRPGLAGCIFVHARASGHFGSRLADRLSVLQGFPVSDFFDPATDDLRRSQQNVGTLGAIYSRPSPAFEGVPRRRHGGIQIFVGAFGYPRNWMIMRRAGPLVHSSLACLYPFAVHKKAGLARLRRQSQQFSFRVHHHLRSILRFQCGSSEPTTAINHSVT